MKLHKSILHTVFILLSFAFFLPKAFSEQHNELTLALLPIPDVLPVHVAEAQGYFKEYGIKVKTLPVGSAVERDQLMQAGKIDGMINELSGAAIFNRSGSQVKVVSVARSPIGSSPLFRILASPKSGIKNAKDLAGKDIGISVNTIIEYVSDRMLVASGLDKSKIQYRSIPVLPERLQLLLSGQIPAVTLPDPLAASALKAGAVEVVNDTDHAEVSGSVITFSTKALTEKKETVQKFMVAWDRATADLNENPAAFKPLMLEKIRVPGNIREEFKIPPFPRKMLPTQSQWQDVMDWMMEKKLVKKPQPYSDAVTNAFLAQ